MGKGKKKGQVQDDWENEMEEIAAEATGLDLTFVTTALSPSMFSGKKNPESSLVTSQLGLKNENYMCR